MLKGYVFFRIVERIATFGWLIIGDVKNELNDPLLDIVKVLPLTSSKPYFPSLSNLEVSEIFLAIPFKLNESASCKVPTNNPSWFKSTAIPKLIWLWISCIPFSKSKEQPVTWKLQISAAI